MTVIPVWSLSLPLPAILIIAVSVYMVLLVGALWCRHCVKAQCSEQCSNCCAYITPCEYCLVCAESCDCRLPSLRTCLDQTCPSPSWDCACTCQRPDCNSINCLCFEIKFR